ncbi:MAG TPA: amino acid adenylation domain-containing protein [Polyangiaceae bacterium]|nr:amino acid adenylation domain-containing protein [Polyangiaceae bacterium]
MSIEAMLQELEQKDISLWVDSGKLKFKAPSGALSDEVRSQLHRHREDLLKYLGRVPLTSAQHALWLQQQWDPGTSAYHIAFAVELREAIPRTALADALLRLAERHPVLRSLLVNDEDGLATVISEASKPELRVRSMPPGSDPSTGFLKAALDERIDLTAEAPLRGYLFENGEKQWFMLVVHHFAADATSFWILWSELDALLRNQELSAPAGASYAEFARSEAKILAGPRRAAASSYYRERLASCATLLDLPNDLPYPKSYLVRGASIDHPLGARAAGVRALAKALRATPYALLMTVFGVWIHRLTGQERFIVGCPLLGRTDPRYSATVGHFVNVSPLRMDFSDGVAFDEAVGETRDELFGAIAHQSTPVGAMAGELEIDRHPSRSALIQVAFGLQNPPPGAIVAGGDGWSTFGNVAARAVRVPQQEGYFELIVNAIDFEDSLELTFKYNTSLFTAASIRRYIECFDTLLDAALADPYAQVGDLPWVPAAQQDEVLRTFNAATCPVVGESVLEAITRVGQERPTATAVVAGERTVSYAELTALSAGVAEKLTNAGLRKGDIVAIAAVPSVDLVIAAVGVLRAGMVYLPIDLEYPAARIAYLLEDSAAKAIICSSRFAAEHSALIRSVGPALVTEEFAPGTVPGVAVEASDTAYLVYTSGSTGKPKGVAVSHGALLNLCSWHNEAFQVTPEDRASKYAGWGFDASVWEIFPYLCIGASLHVVPEDCRLDVERLNGFLERERITIAFLPTPICERFLSCTNQGLRLLLTGGEALHSERHAGRYTLINNYGPTEACVVSTSGPARRHSSGVIPIGRPIANTSAFVVANDGTPCPVGVAGELCVGGAQLAQGYPRNPEETGRRFSELSVLGGRVYRTGDRARWLDTGELQFLGRLDRQVKVRGVRVELEEIEQVLSAVPLVDKVVVTLRTDDQPQLVAYYVSAARVPQAALLTQAREQLVSAAVPAHFVLLDQLPLTANGKVDLRALPNPTAAVRVGDEASFSDFEAQLADLWKQHLRVSSLKRSDGFFDLGGDSLLAAKLVADVARHFKADLPAKILVDAADFCAFCAVVQQVMSGKRLKEKAVTPEELIADSELANGLGVSPNAQLGPQKRVILTGATGFVGAFLLEELLRDEDVMVTCLVRALGHVEARERLRKTLLRYDLPESLLDRVSVVAADLSKERLGVDNQIYERLAQQHGQIFHCAAWVNFTYSYNALKEANVGGTLRVLELACAGPLKKVHYISAGSAAEASRVMPGNRVLEDDPLDAPERLSMGYSQSKWVAERLVQSVFSRGLPGSIQRLGLVWGHSKTGVSNAQDLAMRCMLTSLELGAAPIWQHALHFTTVDFTVRAIVALATTTEDAQTYHLTAGEGISSEKQFQLLKQIRPELVLLPYAEWRARLLSAIGADGSHPLAPFRHFFSEDFKEPSLEFDNRGAAAVLERLGISCASLSVDLLGRYQDYFARSGPSKSAPAPANRDLDAGRLN